MSYQVGDDGADDTDAEGTAHRHEAGGGRDGDEAHHGTHAGTHGRGLRAAHVVDEDPREHGRGGGRVGGQEGLHGEGVRREGRAGVETEPAEPETDRRAEKRVRRSGRRGACSSRPLADYSPEEGRAEHDEGDRGGRDLLGGVVALAQHPRGDQGRVTRRHVHDRAAGEVQDAGLVEQALGVPHHVRQGRVQEDGEERDEDHVRREAHTLGQGTRDQRGRDHGELQGGGTARRQNKGMRQHTGSPKEKHNRPIERDREKAER